MLTRDVSVCAVLGSPRWDSLVLLWVRGLRPTEVVGWLGHWTVLPSVLSRWRRGERKENSSCSPPLLFGEVIEPVPLCFSCCFKPQSFVCAPGCGCPGLLWIGPWSCPSSRPAVVSGPCSCPRYQSGWRKQRDSLLQLGESSGSSPAV